MLDKQLQHIQQMIGELASKVSEIDLRWYLMLTCFMHQAPREITHAVVNVHRTGEGQRQTIMAVAKGVFPEKSDELIFVGLLKERTDALVGRRNAAIHSVIFIAPLSARIIAMGASKPSKLPEADIPKELKACLWEANTIISAADSFIDALDVTGQQGHDLIRPALKAGWKSPLSETPPA